jgi:DNA helicase-2/ATP-dependent DNA helicase PcrA
MNKIIGSHLDRNVDDKILEYLNLDSPRSFLLFAGAGSGKTRTLVNVLDAFKKKYAAELILRGQKVAIITFTNAACEEIKHRLKYDPLFNVSTIHSFSWDLIKPFSEDIKGWLEVDLKNKIDLLSKKIEKARNKKGKTALLDASKLSSASKRLERLKGVRSFTYSPSGERLDKDSLNHAEVIKIATSFLSLESLMKKLLIKRYPILLIDESQDTQKDLLNSLIETQQGYKNQFSLGLFGDLMQRIYSGGKEDLNKESLPSDWEYPSKNDNYRCPKRVVRLLNKVRSEVDLHSQEPCEKSEEGFVRLFLVDSDTENKFALENRIREKMSEVTGDGDWSSDVKCLTLEHAMAARRGQFDKFFLPLSEVSNLRDAVLSGESKTLRFLTQQLMPISNALINNAEFEVMRLLKKYSPLLSGENFTLEQVHIVSSACEKLKILLDDSSNSIFDIIEYVIDASILDCPDTFKSILFIKRDLGGFEEDGDDKKIDVTSAWEKALASTMEQLGNYISYLNDELSFGTHQGVKGLEFERVMAVMDDAEANGFLFKYEKFFGAEILSDTDIKNIEIGKDSSPDRTRRLFYVICSRAEKSLALVNYTNDRNSVRKKMLEEDWFEDDEIILFD